MKKNEEEIKLVKDWLRFARENLLFARSGMTGRINVCMRDIHK